MSDWEQRELCRNSQTCLIERLLAVFLQYGVNHVGDERNHNRDQANDDDLQHTSSPLGQRLLKKTRPKHQCTSSQQLRFYGNLMERTRNRFRNTAFKISSCLS
jgi:hypothetical protein